MTVVNPVPSFGPQDHELEINNREMIVVFPHLAYIHVYELAGHCDFTALLKNFRIVKPRFAGDETSAGLIGIFRPH